MSCRAPWLTLPLALGLLAASTLPALAQGGDVAVTMTESFTLDRAAGPEYWWGRVVDFDGDSAVVLGLQEAHVFVRSGTSWSEQARLIPPAGAGFAERAIAIDGDTVVVGYHYGAFGKAHVYARNGTDWSFQQTLQPSIPNGQMAFGLSVDVSGDTIVVGAPSDSWFCCETGSVWVYTRSGITWSEQARILLGQQPGSHFGVAVAIDGDTLAAGANQEAQDIFLQSGIVGVYVRNGTDWSEQATLRPGDFLNWDFFGHSVAIHGDTLIGGAPQDDAGGPPNAGSAYVYTRSGTAWTQQIKLLPGVQGHGDKFGSGVSIQGDTAIVGSPGADGAGADDGALYAFVRRGTDWTAEAKLARTSPGIGEVFCSSIQVDRSTVLAASGNGTVYGFQLDRVPEVFCTGKTNSTGCVPFIAATGLPSASSTHPFVLSARDVVPSQAGLLLYGYAKSSLGFHGGTLCVKSPIIRTTPKAPKNPGGGCSGWTLRRNFNKNLQSGIDPALTVGAQVVAQWIQRDPADPTSFGDTLTNGIQFVVEP